MEHLEQAAKTEANYVKSYHQIYKDLQELTAIKVLEKTETGYKINREWIRRLREFAEGADGNVRRQFAR